MREEAVTIAMIHDSVGHILGNTRKLGQFFGTCGIDIYFGWHNHSLRISFDSTGPVSVAR